MNSFQPCLILGLGLLLPLTGCQSTSAQRQTELLEQIAEQNRQIIERLDKQQAEAEAEADSAGELAVIGELNGQPIYLFEVLNAATGRAFPGEGREEAIRQSIRGVLNQHALRQGVELFFQTSKLQQIRAKANEQWHRHAADREADNTGQVRYPTAEASLDANYLNYLMAAYEQFVLRANSEAMQVELALARKRARAQGANEEAAAEAKRRELSGQYLYRARHQLFDRAVASREELQALAEQMVLRVDQLAP